MTSSVKECAIILAVLAVLSASLALAEDFKTIDGKVYKNATISRVEADGIVLKTKTGICKVYFVELPKDVQERFHYGPATPVAAQRQGAPVKLQEKQATPRPTEAGRWAAVMANPASFVKVLVAGTVIIAGVVFIIVHRRF